MTDPSAHETAHRLAKELTDKGLLVEAGWQGLAAMAYPDGMGDTQRRELRAAFFAGAHHLFSSIMGILDTDSEPTEADMRRMGMIEAEIEAFLQSYKREHGISDDLIPPAPAKN